MKRILVVSATKFEIKGFIEFLQTQKKIPHNQLFGQTGYTFDVLITGVGIANTAFELGRRLQTNIYDLAINAGVAGSFSSGLKLGEVVEVISEQYGDLGVEESDGSFTDIFELKLIPENESPFVKTKLINKTPLSIMSLRSTRGLTVQKVHGSADSITAVKKKFSVDVESMEGAAFFQACSIMKIPFAQFRAISNYVAPRDRAAWQIQRAIDNLNDVLISGFEKRLI